MIIYTKYDADPTVVGVDDEYFVHGAGALALECAAHRPMPCVRCSAPAEHAPVFGARCDVATFGAATSVSEALASFRPKDTTRHTPSQAFLTYHAA